MSFPDLWNFEKWESSLSSREELKIVTDRDTNRGKGFGVVEFLAPAAASKAIEEMDGKIVSDRILKVAPANPKK